MSFTESSFRNRRNFLKSIQYGLGTTAATAMMLDDRLLGNDLNSQPGALSNTHHPARAKRVVQIVLTGGFSQVDSFDYKPELPKHHGKTLQESLGREETPDVFFGKVGRIRQSDFEFSQHGESGLWISELFPHLATVADELTIINSMFAETSNHTPATFSGKHRLQAKWISSHRIMGVLRFRK
jgi:hypothetical protein